MAAVGLVCLLVVSSLLGQSVTLAQSTSPPRPAATAAATAAATESSAETSTSAEDRREAEIQAMIKHIEDQDKVIRDMKRKIDAIFGALGLVASTVPTTITTTTATTTTEAQTTLSPPDRRDKQIAILNKLVSAVQEKMGDQNTILDDLKKKGAERDRKIEDLQVEKETCNCSAVLATLESKSQAFENELRSLWSLYSRSASQIQRVDGEVTRLKTQSGSVASQVQTLQTRVAALSTAGLITRCRVCFQETEGSSQCQGSRNSCSGWSNVTEPAWTEMFRDDTDNRGGGCKYQWKVECR